MLGLLLGEGLWHLEGPFELLIDELLELRRHQLVQGTSQPFVLGVAELNGHGQEAVVQHKGLVHGVQLRVVRNIEVEEAFAVHERPPALLCAAQEPF